MSVSISSISEADLVTYYHVCSTQYPDDCRYELLVRDGFRPHGFFHSVWKAERERTRMITSKDHRPLPPQSSRIPNPTSTTNSPLFYSKPCGGDAHSSIVARNLAIMRSGQVTFASPVACSQNVQDKISSPSKYPQHDASTAIKNRNKTVDEHRSQHEKRRHEVSLSSEGTDSGDDNVITYRTRQKDRIESRSIKRAKQKKISPLLLFLAS